MGPVLKVKRLKKSISPKSNAVAKSKSKWVKPKKLISSQVHYTDIDNYLIILIQILYTGGYNENYKCQKTIL